MDEYITVAARAVLSCRAAAAEFEGKRAYDAVSN